MKDKLLMWVSGVLLVLSMIAALYQENVKMQECSGKGGVLVRGTVAEGMVCVPGIELKENK